ncbi:unnamed protein product [Chilo suppressalis]|uniref:Uncharacterized protein n=1 Tax=Chilo suppressalis TaxID=168631 RepID=A0ABN8BAI8_CHISP|nr:unnamed protein product [Chilo suppressalis]
MSESKLSSDEVPIKFTEWLLAIGCSPEKVPTVDKVAQMCRGQYYMVWRSLIEHVEPKDIIRQKRLQVFCDDVRKWKRKNTFRYQKHSDAVIPDEIALWQQHHDIKEKVANVEARIDERQKNLNQLMDKISTKLSHRNLSRQRVQDIQRRVWLLQQVTEELDAKKQNLEETRTIANSLCLAEEDIDVHSKLDKYISSLRLSPAPMLTANPAASSTVVSTFGDISYSEEHQSWLTKCRGDALWTQLYERRAGLIAMLTNEALVHKPHNDGSNPERVLSHTASMHGSLALEAMKSRAHIRQTRKRLAIAVSELNNYLTGEACELLVLQCERTRAAARVNTLRNLLADLTSRTGIFDASAQENAIDNGHSTVRQIAAIDKSIESKKKDLQKLLTSLATTEKKIQNVRECLTAIFNGFHKESLPFQHDISRGQGDLPQDSIAALCQFYDERCEARKNKMELSLNFDVSGNSDSEDNRPPKFADELKIYLRQFNLEKNRKLILDSGEKIWIFETLRASVTRLQAYWLENDLPCTLLCPAESLSRNLEMLVEHIRSKKELEIIREAVENGINQPKMNIDLSFKSKEENIIDKIKKRLNENILNLQKTNKTLDGGQENLSFWADNEVKKFISRNRTVEGKTYNDYESNYMESVRLSS